MRAGDPVVVRGRWPGKVVNVAGDGDPYVQLDQGGACVYPEGHIEVVSPQLRAAFAGVEPECCGIAMVRYPDTAYECADAFFALKDDDVIDDNGASPPVLDDDATPEQRALHEHLLATRIPITVGYWSGGYWS